MTISNLIPVRSQQSFYNKAKVVTFDDGMTALISYNTVVAFIKDGKLHRVWDDWSATTAKHIDSYNRTFGNGTGICKADWVSMPVERIPDGAYEDEAVDVAKENTFKSSNNWLFGYNRNLW